MTPTKRALLDKLWGGVDPLANVALYPADEQGWNSDHPYLTEAIAARPALVIEVGVWKGASLITMAKCMAAHGSDAMLIAVDTWLGSAEHWHRHEIPRHPSGRAMLYEVFLSNVQRAGLADFVVPLPLNSASAAEVLAKCDIVADVVHLDAGHSFEECQADLRRWWKLLRPGGLIVVDDYGGWETVKRAVDEFKASAASFEASGVKCRMTKRV